MVEGNFDGWSGVLIEVKKDTTYIVYNQEQSRSQQTHGERSHPFRFKTQANSPFIPTF